jgi:hypothetical protein
MCVWPALLMRNAVGDDASWGDAGDDYGVSMDEFKVAVSKQSKMDKVVATIVSEAASASGSDRRKSIVFCHYRREMTQLRDMLLRSGCVGAAGAGAGVVSDEKDIAIIDGSVGARERSRIFASMPTVLILQIRTCSEGLNLQSYSDVYFVSPHWNPCVEDQAIARCYRMGQTKGVRVFRFYMSDFVIERSGIERSGIERSGIERSAGEAKADAVIAGEPSECISTLDHKCEEIQERKRVLCNEFLC